MKIFTLVIFFLLWSSLLAAQRHKAGFISPTDSLAFSLQNESILYIPGDGFTLYSKPNPKDSIGIIIPIFPNLPQPEPPFTLDLTGASMQLNGQQPQILSGQHLFKTFDDCLHIPIYQNKNGFVKVLKSYNDSLWILIDEISAKGFQLKSWIDFYGSDGMMITVPKGHSVPLLRSPYADAEVLLQLDDIHFDIRVSYFDEQNKNCCEGLYCYVQVAEYKTHPCFGGAYEGDNIVQKLSGWIKIIDREGKRLILHNAGGC